MFKIVVYCRMSNFKHVKDYIFGGHSLQKPSKTNIVTLLSMDYSGSGDRWQVLHISPIRWWHTPYHLQPFTFEPEKSIDLNLTKQLHPFQRPWIESPISKPGYMDVSKNSGTPKSSILIGFSILNHPFWGNGYSYFWKHPYIQGEKKNTIYNSLGAHLLWTCSPEMV